jgi:topoisomerase-4 subunit A
VLEGYLVAYLNIDEVIRIIREEDEPKLELMNRFGLSDVQAEAVLNMRLRSLRKLEEIEIRTEHDKLSRERDDLQKLIASETRQWTAIKKQIGEIKKKFGQDTTLGARRTEIGNAPSLVDVDTLEEAMIEKEPVTVICSRKGWIKAMKGHGFTPKDIKYKDGDRGRFVIEAQTTDKLMVMGTNGRFYTIGCDKLPSGRGFGEPLRLMVDLPNDSDIAVMDLYRPGIKLLVASDDGRGFIVKSDDIFAQTRQGKQVLNPGAKAEAKVCYAVDEGDDHVAVMGQNRKMLVFSMEELPEMSRGKGVILQRYKDGGLADVKTFNAEKGLAYRYGSGETVVSDITPWLGRRAGAGKMPPNGFPKSNMFT